MDAPIDVRRLPPLERHNALLHAYTLNHGKGSTSSTSNVVDTDYGLLRKAHRFVWDDIEDSNDGLSSSSSYAARLAKRYYDRLFKEYAIADLSRYKEGKVGLRWRIENEVYTGRGQFACGAKGCKVASSLRSWEVNFGYKEANVSKNTLVKLRLCPECSDKLNFKTKRRAAVKAEKVEARMRRYREAEEWVERDVQSLPKKKRRLSSGENVCVDEEGVSNSDKSNVSPSDASGLWSRRAAADEVNPMERTRDDEMDDFFEGLFE